MSVKSQSPQDDIDEMEFNWTNEDILVCFLDDSHVQQQSHCSKDPLERQTARINYSPSRTSKSACSTPRCQNEQEESRERTRAKNRESARRSRVRRKKEDQALKYLNEKLGQQHVKLKQDVQCLEDTYEILSEFIISSLLPCKKDIHDKADTIHVPNRLSTDERPKRSNSLGDNLEAQQGAHPISRQNDVSDEGTISLRDADTAMSEQACQSQSEDILAFLDNLDELMLGNEAYPTPSYSPAKYRNSTMGALNGDFFLGSETCSKGQALDVDGDKQKVLKSIHGHVLEQTSDIEQNLVSMGEEYTPDIGDQECQIDDLWPSISDSFMLEDECGPIKFSRPINDKVCTMDMLSGSLSDATQVDYKQMQRGLEPRIVTSSSGKTFTSSNKGFDLSEDERSQSLSPYLNEPFEKNRRALSPRLSPRLVDNQTSDYDVWTVTKRDDNFEEAKKLFKGF